MGHGEIPRPFNTHSAASCFIAWIVGEYRVLIGGSTSQNVSGSTAEVVLVLTTIAAEADGAALARTLVDERLAACVNVLPTMTSVYRWKGQVEQDREQQVIIK